MTTGRNKHNMYHARQRVRCVVVLIAASAALAVCAHGQLPVTPEAAELRNKPITDALLRLPVDDRTAVEIDRMIAKLGSADYASREAATDTLLSIGATAFGKMRDAYRESDDLEVRLRIEGVVKMSYLTHHVFSKTGFLGMQRGRTFPSHDDDPRIPEGNYGVVIDRVLPDTGAERAGLKKGDIIIELDGAPLEGVGNELFLNFSAIIRKTGPGEQLNLTILRTDDGVFEVTATLGPVQQNSFTTVAGMNEIIPAVNDRFDIWWERYFRGTSASASAQPTP